MDIRFEPESDSGVIEEKAATSRCMRRKGCESDSQAINKKTEVNKKQTEGN